MNLRPESQTATAQSRTAIRTVPDMSRDHGDVSALVSCGNVDFRITDHFATYLAQKQSAELSSYLEGKADEIRRFIAAIEARIGQVGP